MTRGLQVVVIPSSGEAHKGWLGWWRQIHVPFCLCCFFYVGLRICVGLGWEFAVDGSLSLDPFSNCFF